MSNGFLVCRGHCHRLLHDKRWTVTGDANTTLQFHDPNSMIQHTSDPKVPDIRRQTRHARQRARERDQIIKRIESLRVEVAERTRGAAPPLR